MIGPGPLAWQSTFENNAHGEPYLCDLAPLTFLECISWEGWSKGLEGDGSKDFSDVAVPGYSRSFFLRSICVRPTYENSYEYEK
jgi:hypothetical protein